MGGGKPADVPATAAADASAPLPTTPTSTDGTAPAAAGRTQLEQGSQLDLCFLLDSTGSMSSYIHSALNSIKDIVEKIMQKERCDVRFALISYRDHPPQDQSYVTKVFDFTDNTTKMAGYLASISAAGGGDGPEAVTASMFQALNMPWRPNATKVAVIIADAPPHGLGESGDGFANGDPDGHDPLVIARQMQQKGITIFSVACEPSLSTSYKFALDFFRAIAKMTGGSLLPLTSAALLPDAIIGGAQEQINLERLVAEAKQEAEKLRKDGVAETEIARNIHANWAKANVRTRQVKTTEMYAMTVQDVANMDAFSNSDSLDIAKNKVVAVASPSRFSEAGRAAVESASTVPLPSMRYSDLGAAAVPMASTSSSSRRSWFGSMSKSKSAAVPRPATAGAAPAAPAAPAVQTYAVEEDLISMEQVERVMSKVSSAS